MKTSFIISTAFVAVAAAVDVSDNNENETQNKIKNTSYVTESQSQQPHHRHGRRSLAKASKIAKSSKVPKSRKSNKSSQVETSMPSISSLPSSQPSSTPSNTPSTPKPTPKWTPPPVSKTPSTQPSSQPSTEPSSEPSSQPSSQPSNGPSTIIPTKWTGPTPTTIPTMEPQIVATKRSGHVTWFRWGANRALRWWHGIEDDDNNNEMIAYDEKKYGHRLLDGTSNYNPTTLNEVMQIAKEGNGNLDSEYIIKKNLLTSEECALLVAYTNENEGTPVGMNTSDNDHVIKKFPLEDIIGIQRTKELYKFFKDYTNRSSIDQIALRRLTGKSGLSMKLHTDVQPYQLKIALNNHEDFEGGDYVVGDRTGAKRIHLETGSGLLHDSGLVHGHLPHFGEKYILYLISDASPQTQMTERKSI